MKSLRPLLALLLFLLAPALPAQEKTPAPPASPLETKYREGLYAEEAKQDLAAAAKAYQEIVAGFDRDRETASSALFRLGEVYRKQNRPKEAAAAFRRVALEFPDRDPLARLARENLAALGEPLPMVPGAAAPPGVDAEEDKALARLRQLEKESPDVILKPDNGLKKNGCISFDEAASAGYLRVVQWFLEHGASVDVTPSGASPLSLAAAFGRTPMVRFLLEKGAAVAGTVEAPSGGPHEDEATWRVDSPLRMAALNGYLEIVKLLVEKGADVNGRKRERRGEKGEPVIFYTHAPLTAAADAGHRAIVDYLLARGADPNADKGQPLLLAVENGYPELAAALLAGGADVNKAKRELPGGAVIVGQPPLARRRPLPAQTNPGGARGGLGDLKRDWPPTYRGYPDWNSSGGDFFTPLQMAALVAAPELVSLLLKHGAEVDVKSYAGSTALELALVMNRPDVVKLLIKAGANVNHTAPGGMRLIHIPIFRQDQEMYDLLRAAGAEVTGQSPDGFSALHVLVMTDAFANAPDKYFPWVERLLKDGADPNGDEQFRPVNAAAESGSLPMIQMLKAKGADFTPDNADAPLPLVLKNGLTAQSIPVIKALIDAGADPAARSTKSKPSDEPRGRIRPGGIENLNLLQAAAAWVPDLSLLEEVLALKPAPVQSWATVKTIYLDAKKTLEEEAAAPAGSGRVTSRSTSDNPFHTTKEARERVVKAAPAVIQRLWDYEWRERNEQRNQRVWFRMLTNKQGDYQTEETKRSEQGGFSYRTTYDFTAFVPASPGPQPANIVEALAFAYGPAAHEQPDRWKQPGTMPDFTSLTIIRNDPATGRTAQREPVDLAALVEKGDLSALPVLQPGDVIEAIGIQKSLSDWRDFPEPYLAFFRKVLPPRKVTVKAGDWQREFLLDPWVYAFRWDPATSKLAIEPHLSKIIRFLPKPDWFYRLNAVRHTPKDGPAQTLDLSTPLPPEKEITLRDGDRIELEALPADDPALTTRLKQGLFVSREADGFLREVFHDPATPALKWDEDLMTQVVLQYCGNGDTVLPFISTNEMVVRHPAPDTAWGGCLELPRQKDAKGDRWIVPGANTRMVRFLFTDGVTKQSHEFWYQEMQYFFHKEVWSGLSNGPAYRSSRTLAEVVRSVTQHSTAGWSRWELRRKDQAKPLHSFVPGQDAMPFILLQEDDTIQMSTADAAKGQPPPLRVPMGSEGNFGWRHLEAGLLRPVQQSNPVPIPRPGGQAPAPRRRLVSPRPGN